MTTQLQLALRKRLIEDVARDFDAVYRRLAPREAMVFADAALRRQFPEVTFSATAMLLGCGSVRTYEQRCASGAPLQSTLPYTGCTLVWESDTPFPLSHCQRTWQLRGAPPAPCGDECGLCTVVRARHTASLALLAREMEREPRYVALRCLIQAPINSIAWRAYDRGELLTSTCARLPTQHACSLLIDTANRSLYLCESQQVTPMVTDRVAELATALGIAWSVHPLAQQWESLACGTFPYKWCMLFSEAMALALVRATSATTPHGYLATVYRIMHDFMRRQIALHAPAAHAMSASTSSDALRVGSSVAATP